MSADAYLPTPDGNIARFEMERVVNRKGAEAAGRPVYDTVTTIVVTSPGLTKTEHAAWIHKQMHDGSERRNEKVWALYGSTFEMWRDNVRPTQHGTPLDAWPGLTRQQIETCERNRITTVEALASLPDSALSVLGMGGRTLRDNAARFVQEQSGGAVHAMLSQAHDQIAELREQIERLSANQGAPAPRRPRSRRAAASEAAEPAEVVE
jgi:hypothetical protein